MKQSVVIAVLLVAGVCFGYALCAGTPGRNARDRRVHVVAPIGASLPAAELRGALEKALADQGWTVMPEGSSTYVVVPQIRRVEGKTLLELLLVLAQDGRTLAQAATNTPEQAMPRAAAPLISQLIAAFDALPPWPHRDPRPRVVARVIPPFVGGDK